LIRFEEAIDTVLVHLAGGGIERDRNLRTGNVAGVVDGLEQQVDGLLIGPKLWSEAALIANRGGIALLLQRAFQLVEDLHAHPQARPE